MTISQYYFEGCCFTISLKGIVLILVIRTFFDRDWNSRSLISLSRSWHGLLDFTEKFFLLGPVCTVNPQIRLAGLNFFSSL